MLREVKSVDKMLQEAHQGKEQEDEHIVDQSEGLAELEIRAING